MFPFQSSPTAAWCNSWSGRKAAAVESYTIAAMLSWSWHDPPLYHVVVRHKHGRVDLCDGIVSHQWQRRG